MAVPVPKDPAQRVNRHKPVSEWVDLEPLAEPVLPAYPMAWYKREARPWVMPKYIWDLWRTDPVTSQWSSADIATALELGSNWHRLKPEHRLRVQTQLGLNAYGRRQLRWRNPTETRKAEEANEKAATVRRLRIVADREARKGDD